jgi:hypothetical protein
MLHRTLLPATLASAAALALLSTLAVAPCAAAQPFENMVTWTPQDPMAGELVMLNISGWWRDSGIPRVVALHRDPPAEEFPEVYADPEVAVPIAARWVVVLEPTPGHLSAVTPYWHHVSVSPLPAGINRVLVIVLDEIEHAPDEPPRRVIVGLVDILAGGSTDVLSLHGGRFLATVSWRDYQGNPGQGVVVPGHARSSGLFTFFAPDNWEVMVKVLDGCALNGRFWVFVAAATSVEYTLRIEDVATAEVWERSNPLGQLSPAFADTSAFEGCASP